MKTDPSGAQNLAKRLELSAPAVEQALELLRPLVEPVLAVIGDTVADRLVLWQWKRRFKIAQRATEVLQQGGIATRVPPPEGFLMELLEGAEKADEPELQEVWANLLASAVEDKNRRHPMFIGVLRNMSAGDAREFTKLCRRAVLGRRWSVDREGLLPRLLTLGLVEKESPPQLLDRLRPVVAVQHPKSLRISDFGIQFARAVRIPHLRRRRATFGRAAAVTRTFK